MLQRQSKPLMKLFECRCFQGYLGIRGDAKDIAKVTEQAGSIFVASVNCGALLKLTLYLTLCVISIFHIFFFRS